MNTNVLKHKVIAVVGSKGGVGKSTVAFNLAVRLEQQGGTVRVYDTDAGTDSMNRKLTARNEYLARARAEGTADLPFAKISVTPCEGREVAQAAYDDADHFDHVIIDVPNPKSTADIDLITACTAADIILAVFEPEVDSVAARGGLLNHIANAVPLRRCSGAEPFQAFAVINNSRTQAIHIGDKITRSRVILADNAAGMVPLRSILSNRKAFAPDPEANEYGVYLSPFEMAASPGVTNARIDFDAVLSELIQRIALRVTAVSTQSAEVNNA